VWLVSGMAVGLLNETRKNHMGSESSGLRSLFGVLFGCAHTRTTFPTTRSGASREGNVCSATRVTCLNCGEELPYDWQKMEVEGGGTRGRGLLRWVRVRVERITGGRRDRR